MDSEFKRAMKLIWGNKRTRASFGCGFGVKLSEGGWVIVLMAALGLAPVIAKLFGRTFSDRTLMIFMAISAVLWEAVLISFSQKVFARYGKLGKYFGSLPMAKYVMTKGHFFNTWILWAGGLLLTSLLYGICVLMGATPWKGFYVILFLFGVIFFMDGLCCAFRNKNHPENDVYYSVGTSISIMWIISFVRSMVRNTDDVTMKGVKPEKLMVWFAIFMVFGNLLLYFFAKKRYKERSTAALDILGE